MKAWLAFCAFPLIALQSSPFAGVWHSADLKDDLPQAVVTLRMDRDKPGGTVLLRGLRQDGRDNVTLEVPILEAKAEGRTCSFKLRFPQKPQPILTEWEFTLGEHGQAQLRLLRDDDGPVEDGPSFKMTRAGAP